MKILKHYFDINQFPRCKESYKADPEAVMDVLITNSFANSWKANVPEEYQDTDPDLIPEKSLKSLMLDDQKGVYLYGKAGNFKTRAAICLFAKELMSGKKIRFLSAEQFVIGSMTITNTDENGKTMLDRVCDCDVLMIDDLFKRRMTEPQEFFLYCLLERRGKKKNIITSNIPFSEIPDMFSEQGTANSFVPIMRRIKENCRIIRFS